MDNLAEKVDECPLNRGRKVLFAYNRDRKNCLLYGVAGCLLFRGCLSVEVNGRTVWTFGIVHYIVGVRCWGVSIKRGSTVYHKHFTAHVYYPHWEYFWTTYSELLNTHSVVMSSIPGISTTFLHPHREYYPELQQLRLTKVHALHSNGLTKRVILKPGFLPDI